MGKLVVVPTPVGNLEDITFRALNILKQADIILCEDTRVTQKLLTHFDIQQKLASYHQHNEHKQLPKFLEMVGTHEIVALVSDAGTPAISDPGFLLVRECIENELEVECLPGPTALIPALVTSGLPNNAFTFIGFLPPKKGRQTKLKEVMENKYTTVFYESPHKLLKTLGQLCELEPDRQISVSREISKMFEETKRGTSQEVLKYFEEKGVKGEFVICVAGKSK